jgi:hypothetical protein
MKHLFYHNIKYLGGAYLENMTKHITHGCDKDKKYGMIFLIPQAL